MGRDTTSTFPADSWFARAIYDVRSKLHITTGTTTTGGSGGDQGPDGISHSTFGHDVGRPMCPPVEAKNRTRSVFGRLLGLTAVAVLSAMSPGQTRRH